MKSSSPASSPSLFSRLYVEEAIMDHPRARALMERFERSSVIPIGHYKEVFNRRGQDFAAQSGSKNLILARREGKFLHCGSPYSNGFGHERFFYASTLMGCQYDCDYCYLQGLYPSANSVLFVNLEDAFAELLPYLDAPTLVATSYDTDTLALEGLTGQTREWLLFAAAHPNLHLEIRTKSANFKPLRSITPNPNVVLAWTLSPQKIIDRYEHATPSLDARLRAAREAMEAGWKVRLCIDPVIYTGDFSSLYPALIDTVFTTLDAARIEHLTLGSFRMAQSHLRALKKLARSDVAFYPYTVRDETATYPESVEREILETLLAKARVYLDDERIRTWQRQS